MKEPQNNDLPDKPINLERIMYYERFVTLAVILMLSIVTIALFDSFNENSKLKEKNHKLSIHLKERDGQLKRATAGHVSCMKTLFER